MRNQAPGGIPSFGIKTVGRINFKNRQIIMPFFGTQIFRIFRILNIRFYLRHLRPIYP